MLLFLDMCVSCSCMLEVHAYVCVASRVLLVTSGDCGMLEVVRILDF